MKSHVWTLMFCIAFLMISVTADSYVIGKLKKAHDERFPNLNWSSNLASQAEKALDEKDCRCNIKDLKTKFSPKKIFPIYYERQNYLVKKMADEFVVDINREKLIKRKNRFGCDYCTDNTIGMAILCLYEK